LSKQKQFVGNSTNSPLTLASTPTLIIVFIVTIVITVIIVIIVITVTIVIIVISVISVIIINVAQIECRINLGLTSYNVVSADSAG
jgi:hypothetical protein